MATHFRSWTVCRTWQPHSLFHLTNSLLKNWASFVAIFNFSFLYLNSWSSRSKILSSFFLGADIRVPPFSRLISLSRLNASMRCSDNALSSLALIPRSSLISVLTFDTMTSWAFLFSSHLLLNSCSRVILTSWMIVWFFCSSSIFTCSNQCSNLLFSFL